MGASILVSKRRTRLPKPLLPSPPLQVSSVVSCTVWCSRFDSTSVRLMRPAHGSQRTFEGTQSSGVLGRRAWWHLALQDGVHVILRFVAPLLVFTKTCPWSFPLLCADREGPSRMQSLAWRHVSEFRPSSSRTRASFTSDVDGTATPASSTVRWVGRSHPRAQNGLRPGGKDHGSTQRGEVGDVSSPHFSWIG